MANVLIERDTMTAIADALRAHHGDTKLITSTNPLVKISKTSNVTDKDTYDSSGYGNSKETFDVITIPGATTLEVTLTYQTESTNYDWVQIAKGELSSSSSFTGTKYGGSTKKTTTLTYPGTNTITIYFKSDSSSCSYFGYYAEVRGYDANGDYVTGTEEVANTYKPVEMPGAIDSIPIGVFPEGELKITKNGSHDVTNYTNAVVDVSGAHDFGNSVPVVRVAKSDNVISPDEYSTTDLFNLAPTSNSYDYLCKSFFFPEATSLKVKVWFQGVTTDYPYLNVYDYLYGTKLKVFKGTDLTVEEFEVAGNYVFFYLSIKNTLTSGSLGYYAEVTPLDADGNPFTERENPMHINANPTFFASGINTNTSSQTINLIESQTLFLDNLDGHEYVSVVFQQRFVDSEGYNARFGLRSRKGWRDYTGYYKTGKQIDAEYDSSYLGEDNIPLVSNERETSICELVINVKNNTCVSIRPWIISQSSNAHYNALEVIDIKYT